MKVTVLNGSPRKSGNTALLVESFAKGASSHNEVEVINVCELDIHPCVGCNACFQSTDNKCVQNDGMEALYCKLAATDLLVLASPVYFYGLSAQLKIVIDRLHNPRRNNFNISKIGLLLVGAASLPKMFDAILLQYQLTIDFFHLENIGSVLVQAVKDKGDIVGRPELEHAYNLGLSIR